MRNYGGLEAGAHLSAQASGKWSCYEREQEAHAGGRVAPAPSFDYFFGRHAFCRSGSSSP